METDRLISVSRSHNFACFRRRQGRCLGRIIETFDRVTMSPSAINTGIGLCAPFLHPISNREMIQGSKIVYHIHKLRNRLNEFSLQRRISSLLCVHLSYNAGYGCYLPHGHSSHLSFQRASFRPIYIASEGAIRPSGTAPPHVSSNFLAKENFFLSYWKYSSCLPHRPLTTRRRRDHSSPWMRRPTAYSVHCCGRSWRSSVLA